MKRCPACKRVENDDALVFCRADGTALIADSGSSSAEAGTVKFGSAAMASEIETSIRPRTGTGADMSSPTGETTLLDAQRTAGGTGNPGATRWRKAVLLAVAAVIIAAIAGLAYHNYARKNSAAINSIA